jgi:hypothetical protein
VEAVEKWSDSGKPYENPEGLAGAFECFAVTNGEVDEDGEDIYRHTVPCPRPVSHIVTYFME